MTSTSLEVCYVDLFRDTHSLSWCFEPNQNQLLWQVSFRRPRHCERRDPDEQFSFLTNIAVKRNIDNHSRRMSTICRFNTLNCTAEASGMNRPLKVAEHSFLISVFYSLFSLKPLILWSLKLADQDINNNHLYWGSFFIKSMVLKRDLERRYKL